MDKTTLDKNRGLVYNFLEINVTEGHMFFEENLTAELLGVFKITRGRSEQSSFDDRVYDCIGIRISGEAVFKCNGKAYDVTSSDMIYLPNSAYYTQKTDGETVIAIHFINYTLEGSRTVQTFKFGEPEKFHELALEIYTAWNEKKRGYKHYCTSLFYKLMYLAALDDAENRLSASENLSGSVNDAVNYIHKNYKNPQLSVSSLADMLSVSQTYFRRLFRKSYNISPMQYIIKLRLEYASQLLLSRFYTVKEVSEKSGFTDPKYFSRVFKEKFGKTPKSYADEFNVFGW